MEIVSNLLVEGQADIGIATEALQDVQELAAFPYYTWHHGVIVPAGHPLAGHAKKAYAGSNRGISHHHLPAGVHGTRPHRRSVCQIPVPIEPDIVMEALDADVIKAYVELGLGIGIIASMAFEARPMIRICTCSMPNITF